MWVYCLFLCQYYWVVSQVFHSKNLNFWTNFTVSSSDSAIACPFVSGTRSMEFYIQKVSTDFYIYVLPRLVRTMPTLRTIVNTMKGYFGSSFPYKYIIKDIIPVWNKCFSKITRSTTNGPVITRNFATMEQIVSPKLLRLVGII